MNGIRHNYAFIVVDTVKYNVQHFLNAEAMVHVGSSSCSRWGECGMFFKGEELETGRAEKSSRAYARRASHPPAL